MPKNWVLKVNIKDLIDDKDGGADDIKQAVDGIIERLPTAPHGKLLKAKKMADDDEEVALLVFNDGLNDVYDWADANRVWLGA